MPRICIGGDKLFDRGGTFNDLLGPILQSKKNGVAHKTWPLNLGSYAITAFDGKTTLNFTDSRFPISLDYFLGQYYEIWKPTDSKRYEKWYLYRAYLTIYNRTQEYVCLHCDPEENEDEKSCYKRSPHLHIKVDHHPISKSHIALAHGYLENVYSSYENFFISMKNGIELISDEILSRYEEK